ncbi:MAG: hypothetical protein PHG25_00300 [Candidatus Pacebacteria bacterium]|nr:hypothetical protein [Candidatus Paceibacterota bacterium]
MQTISAPQSIDMVQFSRDLFSQIATVNATYLAISVSIILGSGIGITILMYFLNYKPTKENLDKQAADIDLIKKETELKVGELRTSQLEVSNSMQYLKDENNRILENLKIVSEEEVTTIKKLFEEKQKDFDTKIKAEMELRINEIGVKMSAIEKTAIEKAKILEEKNRALDISSTWDMHYVWQVQKIPVNTLSSLVTTLEKTIESLKVSNYNEAFIGLCLKELPKTIDEVTNDHPKIFTNLPNTIERLEICLTLIKGSEVEKGVVTAKIQLLRNALS